MNESMTEVTEEQLIALYDRAIQFAICKYGIEPDSSVELNEDGTLGISFTTCSYGECDTDSYTIELSDLNSDLDVLITERKIKEEIALVEAAEKRRLRNIELEKKAKEERRANYIKLRNEFENE
jgi:hypothetical protein